MIFWKDFILDDFLGPSLKDQKICTEKPGSVSVMEDADGISNQETGQEQRPARMVGNRVSSSYSHLGKEATETNEASMQLRGRK